MTALSPPISLQALLYRAQPRPALHQTSVELQSRRARRWIIGCRCRTAVLYYEEVVYGNHHRVRATHWTLLRFSAFNSAAASNSRTLCGREAAVLRFG